MTLRDSYSLVPFPLDEAAEIAGEQSPSLPWSCICRRDCGGYCQIRQRAREGDPDLDDYCMADCRVLYRVLRRLGEHAEQFGLDLRGTLGSTAWASAKHELELPNADLPWHLWRKIRRADKGGRLLIGRHMTRGPGAHFDIVNAYPGALARARLPVGRPRELGSRHATVALGRSAPGVYQVTIWIPDSLFVPPLPWRCGGRVVYPTGTISGSWALPELEAALERGCVVERVHSAIIWPVAMPVFADLMRRWYEIRRKVGRQTPLGQWQSRLAKALTGKFAELPGRARITVHPEKIRICPRTGHCRRGCTGRCGAMNQLDLFGYVWESPYFKLAPSGHAHWSAYLRAITRVQWLEAAERYRPGELAYGDTDSIWVTGNTRPEPLSAELGAWEMKHVFTDFEVRAPKVYKFTDGSGRPIFRGAPGLTDEDWRRGKATIARGVMTFRQAAHSGDGRLFRRNSRKWTLPQGPLDRESPDGIVWLGDRKLDLVTGITYPASATEHRAHKAHRDHL